MFSSSSYAGQFEKLFDEYYFKVKNFTNGFVKDRFSADEIVQNVFLKLWHKKDTLESVSNMSAYIFKVCRNEIIDYFRSSATKKSMKTVSLVSDEEYDQFADQMLDYSIIHNAVMEFVSQMPEQRRKIFLMSREGNMSNAEIAETLGISQRTVETHISKALYQLREFLEAFKIFLLFL